MLKQCASRNIANTLQIPSTVNQSLYFGMAYFSIVWLKESLSKEEMHKALKSERMNGVWANIKSSGPRDITADEQKMSLIRNALSHGHVSIDDNFIFHFWDINSRTQIPESAYTHIFISNDDLGKLVTQFYYAVSDVLYQGTQGY